MTLTAAAPEIVAEPVTVLEPDGELVPQLPSLPLCTQTVKGSEGTESGACACRV